MTIPRNVFVFLIKGIFFDEPFKRQQEQQKLVITSFIIYVTFYRIKQFCFFQLHHIYDECEHSKRDQYMFRRYFNKRLAFRNEHNVSFCCLIEIWSLHNQGKHGQKVTQLCERT